MRDKIDDAKYWLKNHNYEWKYKLMVCLPLFVFLVIFDWVSKIAIQLTMNQGETKHFLDGFLGISYIINPGSAYGANAGNVGLAIALAVIITIMMSIIFIFLNSKHWLIPLTFILSGSFANLLARAWAPAVIGGSFDGQMGGVIDFLHWEFKFLGSDGYIFNVADMWVNIGVFLLICMLIYEIIAFIVKYSKVNNEEELIVKKANNQESENIPFILREQKEIKITGEFEFKDENTLSAEELKRYKKELKAYHKLEKMKERQNDKNNKNRIK